MKREDNYLLEPFNTIGDMIRFHCVYNEGVYRLYMGKGMYREFTPETLPDELKSQIAMINAFDWEALHKDHVAIAPYVASRHETILVTTAPYYPPVSLNLGWRIDNDYAIVVPYKYFLQLKGVLTTSGDKP